MGTFLFRLTIPGNQIAPLFDTLRSIKYTVSEMGAKLANRHNLNGDQKILNITISVPRGEEHYNHCTNIFEQYDAILIDGRPGSLINVDWKERFTSFLTEKGKEALGIYLGTVAVVFGVLGDASFHIPVTDDHPEHLLFLITGIEYTLMLLLAAVPSVVHLVTVHGSFSKRYKNEV